MEEPDGVAGVAGFDEEAVVSRNFLGLVDGVESGGRDVGDPEGSGHTDEGLNTELGLAGTAGADEEDPSRWIGQMGMGIDIASKDF